MKTRIEVTENGTKFKAQYRRWFTWRNIFNKTNVSGNSYSTRRDSIEDAEFDIRRLIRREKALGSTVRYTRTYINYEKHT